MHRSEIFKLTSVIVFATLLEFYHVFSMQMTRSQRAHNVIHPALEIGNGPMNTRAGQLTYLRDMQQSDGCKCLGVWPSHTTIQRGRNMCNGARIALNALHLPGMPACTAAECVPRQNLRFMRRSLARWSWACAFYCNEVAGRPTVTFNNEQRTFYWITEIQIPDE